MQFIDRPLRWWSPGDLFYRLALVIWSWKIGAFFLMGRLFVFRDAPLFVVQEWAIAWWEDEDLMRMVYAADDEIALRERRGEGPPADWLAKYAADHEDSAGEQG